MQAAEQAARSEATGNFANFTNLSSDGLCCHEPLPTQQEVGMLMLRIRGCSVRESKLVLRNSYPNHILLAYENSILRDFDSQLSDRST